MIARGDLAVECGWECLAQVQEEILCTCLPYRTRNFCAVKANPRLSPGTAPA